MYITENDNPRIEFLRDKTHRLTESPGCYIMKNKTHEIIYIGKAKNLKNRVMIILCQNQNVSITADILSVLLKHHTDSFRFAMTGC